MSFLHRNAKGRLHSHPKPTATPALNYTRAKLIIWNHETYPAERVREAAVFVLGTMAAAPEDITQASSVI